MNTKEKGNIGIASAILYYTQNRNTVSIPLNDSQNYDLVVDIDTFLYKVQVKFTASKAESGNYVVSLRSISGSSRQEYSTLKDTDVDILFIVTDSGLLVEIPVIDINQKSMLTLTNDIINKYSVKI